MSKARLIGAIALAASAVATNQSMGAALTALSSFGGGDGWLAPGEGGYAYLGTANNERGLAYGNGHVYLVSRANVSGSSNNIRILDASSGSDLGGLNASGITSGTFTINTIGVGGDGAIYVNNLATTSATANLKVYSWATEGSAPNTVYSGNAGLLGARVGDSLAVTGSGTNTRLALGYGNSPAIAGNNGYALIDPSAGTASAIAFTGTPPNAGDFRLGITFTDASHLLGSQGSSLYRYTSYSGSTGTLIGSPTFPDPSGATADRLLAATVISGVPVLAVQSTGDGHVSVYDISNPAAPAYLASGLNIVGAPTANSNGTGQIAWGAVDNVAGSATLYAMSTNSGIQAFTFQLPEPATMAAVGGMAGLLLKRRRA